jgi:hypothetical protein
VAITQGSPRRGEAAGRLIRPYAVSNGRTHPTAELDLLSQVMATGVVLPGHLAPELTQARALCERPTSVAEIAAHLRLPVVVTKVLLSDLMECGAVTTRAPRSDEETTDLSLLEAVLDGLRRRL